MASRLLGSSPPCRSCKEVCGQPQIKYCVSQWPITSRRTHVLLALVDDWKPIVDEGKHRRVAGQHGIGVGASEARKVVVAKQVEP
jgi:hypothetical protein